MKRNIVVNADTNLCKGEIEILNKSDKNAYVQWKIFDHENKLVASLTNNYYIGNQVVDDNEIFCIVKDAILKYRIGRKKLFNYVEFA